MEDSGCYYVEEYLLDIEGSGQWSSGVHPLADSEAFTDPQDPALLALFREFDEPILTSVESVLLRKHGEGIYECQHEPAARMSPPIGSPLPTCKHCGIAYCNLD
jgi:hypothetical protein